MATSSPTTEDPPHHGGQQSAQRMNSSNRPSRRQSDEAIEDDSEYELPYPSQTRLKRSSSRQLSSQGRSSHGHDVSVHAADRESSDPPDPHRPNKYHGPASTWRDWTAADRDVSRSVDMLRARDLSIHLFNSYALRIRAQKSAQAKGTRKSSKTSWTPSNEWSAWPMLAKDVPRLDADPLDDQSLPHDKVASSLQSREYLRELLLAQITKTAREQFKERDCEGCDGCHSYEPLKQRQPAVTVPPRDLSTRRESDEDTLSSDSLPVVATHEMETTIKRSHSDISRSSSRSRKRRRDTSDQPELEPIPIIDDDQAMRIVRPSIEHLISSLERLLNGLHIARQHYFAQPIPAQKSQAGKRKTESKTDFQGPSVSKSSDRESKRRRVDSDDYSQDEGHSESSIESFQPSLDKGGEQSLHNTSRLRTLKRYGLRDWKDIIGMAAMLGWDEYAIRRARDRCSALFNESMPLARLGLDPMKPKVEQEESATGSTTSESEIEGGIHVDGYMRTIEPRAGWRGKNKQKGNWKSRKKARQVGQMDGVDGKTSAYGSESSSLEHPPSGIETTEDGTEHSSSEEEDLEEQSQDSDSINMSGATDDSGE